MAEIVRWSGGGGIAFFIRKQQILGFRDLGISASAETENKTSGGETYTARKNAGGYEITMTAVLNAQLGVDVQAVALKITEAARQASTGYFYCHSAKLVPANFMLTDAKIEDIAMTASGAWISCEVGMTLKQCSKYNGTNPSAKKKKKTGKGGKKKTGGGKGSVDKPPTLTTLTGKTKQQLVAEARAATKAAKTASKQTPSARSRVMASVMGGGKTPQPTKVLRANALR